jgi:hypothetical protein
MSVQAKNRANLQAWKSLVGVFAIMAGAGPPVTKGKIHLTIVFLCYERAPIDVDNIIKPIQDALRDIVYKNDVIVTDTQSHRRYLNEAVDLTYLPKSLIELVVSNDEGIYVRASNSKELGNHL